MDVPPPPIVTQEIRVVDAQGSPRIVLSTLSGTPVIQILDPAGKPSVSLSTDKDGYPSVNLTSRDATAPTAVLEVDSKGAHVLFERPAGGSSYLFLNNQGVSGTVLIDANGKRRSETLLAADGTPTIVSPRAPPK